MEQSSSSITLSISIKGKPFSVTLDKNQVNAVKSASEYINNLLTGVSGDFNNAQKETVLVYGLLLAADRAIDLEEKVKQMEAEQKKLQEKSEKVAEEELIKQLTNYTKKIDTLTKSTREL